MNNKILFTAIILLVRLSGCSEGDPIVPLENKPPVVPTNPIPVDAATGVSDSPTLNWSCSDPNNDIVVYDVYFDTTTPPATKVATLKGATKLSLTGLSKSKTYYWKVNAADAEDTTIGPLWSFTTGSGDNNPPAAPSTPNPPNAATRTSTSLTLSWSCSDPDGEALTYDVFFDTKNPPTTQVATGQSATNLSRTGLSTDATYYWNVNAKDSKGATTTGSVWSFTTGEGPIAPVMVPVAGGTFTAESTLVTISSFKMDKYEATYELWTDVRSWALSHGYTDLWAGENGRKPSGTNNPVTSVNWYDVVKWCNARSEKEGLTPVYYTGSAKDTVYRIGLIDINIDAVKWNANGYRLPTEAEWEFAARGGNSTHGYPYSGSNRIGDVAWYSSNSGDSTHAVGTKKANELGICDMSGNVMEWCWDWWDWHGYPSGGTTDPKGPSTTQADRLLRGGSFNFEWNYCLVVDRGRVYPNARDTYYGLGFRCVQY